MSEEAVAVTDQPRDTARLRYEILGALRVTRGAIAVHLGGARQRAVLALLLLDPNPPVPVARLADALWGERPPPGHATTIQTYVFHLREALEPDRARGSRARILITDSGGYRLDTADAELDAREFEALARSGLDDVTNGAYEQALAEFDAALGLWHGEVLADVAELDAVVVVAARLNELRLTALEGRIDAQLALGRHALVVGELDELIAANPLRERLHAQRMIALYRCGRQADALAGYRQLGQILDTEIGVEPSPPLRELHRAILAHDVSLDAAAAISATGIPRARPPATAPPVAPAAGGRRRRPWALAATLAAGVLAAGVGIGVVVTHQPRTSLRALPANSVGVVHGNGSLHDAVPVGQSPTGITYGSGSIWVTNGGDDTVSRIDPKTHAVIDVIPVGGDPVAIAASNGDVWVVNGSDSTVDRINITTDNLVGLPIKVGNQPLAIAAGPAGVWVANGGDDTVQHIDTSSRVGAAIPVGGRPDGIAVDADSVWVANGLDGTVSRIVLATNEVLTPIHVGAGPSGMLVLDGSVWVTNSLEQSVSRITVATGAVDTYTDVGDGPAAVASDGRYIWIAVSHSATIARIDARTRNTHRFGIGASPVAIAAVGPNVYVVSQAFESAGHVGGRLDVGSIYLPGIYTGIDPASVYDYWTLEAQRFVYDGLMAFRLANGADGFTVVPDLAARMPTISQDGKTYTFDLRTGIHYSTGQVVQAEDFALGFHRVFTVGGGGNPGLFAGVVGAANCLAHPTACDLTRGVVADNQHHELKIYLTAPDADFLHKLTYLVYPAPPGTSLKQLTTALPSTGPYQLADVGQRRNPDDGSTDTFFRTLVRNPHFWQWSFAAQPAGYPDTIDWHEYPTAQAEVNAVRAGVVDIGRLKGGEATTLAGLISDIRLREPGRLHTATFPDLDWVSLNTEVPPFDNKLVRQAVNYAVDRTQLTKIYFGRGLAEPACQMLPANFPSYSWYCPYTRAGPNAYNGPDLVKARRLVELSGTRGARIVVYGVRRDPTDVAVMVAVTNVLDNLGYKASFHPLPATNKSWALLGDPRNRIQAWGLDGWIADYPSPDTFYDPLVSCRVVNQDPSGFCDTSIDKLAVQARTTALTDASAARRMWTHIDQLVTDEAPWITLGSDETFEYTSATLGNYEGTPFNPIYDQLWVK